MEERVFVISKGTAKDMNRNFGKCPICRKPFKEGDDVVLCPVQKASANCIKSFVTVLSIPVHVKCFYVEDVI